MKRTISVLSVLVIFMSMLVTPTKAMNRQQDGSKPWMNKNLSAEE